MKNIIKNNYAAVYDLLKDLKSWEYIDSMDMASVGIESFYQSIRLDVTEKKKDPYIENELHISPSMVGCFYYFLYCLGKIPSQIDYIKFYYQINMDWVKEKIGTRHHEAFLGRLSRFYPSMLRDIHFYHLLKESGQFDKTLFILKYDLEAKVDIFLKRDSDWYGVQLRTKTKRSNEFYQKKKNRSPIAVNATLVDMPIDLNKAKSLGTKKDAIKLYSGYHIKEILQEIHRIQLQKQADAI